MGETHEYDSMCTEYVLATVQIKIQYWRALFCTHALWNKNPYIVHHYYIHVKCINNLFC
jgi:hypothetical protein